MVEISAVVSFALLRFFVLQCLLFRCRAGMCACMNTNIFSCFLLVEFSCPQFPLLPQPFPGSLRLQDCGLAQQKYFKVPILQSKLKQ